MTFDFIIKKAQVIDGTGAQRTVADIGIKGDTIAALGDLSSAEAARVIDAGDQVVAPGFIDMHNHFDQTILLYPAAQSSVAQGITTAVTGQCGFSHAPLNKHYLACFWEWDWWDRVQSRKYYQEVVGGIDKVRAAAKDVQDLEIDWHTFGEWIRRVEETRPGVNLVPLVGHGTVRAAVMGLDYRRTATEDEVRAMVRYVEQSMDEGAWGISNGMDYAPNAFCSK
ncbi:MAG: amidohydrolase family protein, partial [Firmicutes bacterium]|nr:amidohydrolase family protein [Candidatus Fermentithermobacillaceae bacterium]